MANIDPVTGLPAEGLNPNKSTIVDIPDILDTDLVQSAYDFNYRAFPSDLGGEGSFHRHYMVINISVPNRTNYQAVTYKGQSINTFRKVGSELSKIDVLRYSIDPQFRGTDGVPLGYRNIPGTNTPAVVPRQTTRIAESIAIFMPGTMAYSQQNDYSNIPLTAFITDALSGAAGMVGGVLKGLTGGNSIVNFDSISDYLSNGLKVAQKPINPRVEAYFSNTEQRKFRFDFLCAPTNPKDSETLEQIIRVLRFHAAPELNVTTYGFLYNVPSEFDITFYHNGAENTHIPRINTCVMEDITVDYSPEGVYSTFSNGHPVHCRLSLSLREIETNSKLRILQGF